MHCSFVIDYYYDNFSQVKKVLVLVDAIANGLWGFMWFVCFCYAADQWRRTPKSISSVSVINCGNSGVAFSFFSIIVFVSYRETYMYNVATHKGISIMSFIFESHRLGCPHWQLFSCISPHGIQCTIHVPVLVAVGVHVHINITLQPVPYA